MRILIVEDQADIRDVLWEAFTEGGHSVKVAANYQQGYDALAAGDAAITHAAEPWDLLLTDLILPGGSGLDLALRARGMGIRVLLCSGHPRLMQELEQQGIDYLRKPFTLNHMLDQVAALMATPPPPESGDAPPPEPETA